MKNFANGLIAVILLLATGCSMLSTGTTPQLPDPNPCGIRISSAGVLADYFIAGEEAAFSVPWNFAGQAPFTISIDAGTGESLVDAEMAADSYFNWWFDLVEGESFDWVVTIKDADGCAATATGSYGPVGAPNAPPVIEGISSSYTTVTVTVSDPEGDDIRVSVTDVEGFSIDEPFQVVAGGSGNAVFVFNPTDFMTYADGLTTVSVRDEYNHSDPATGEAYISNAWAEPVEGEIVAHAMSATAQVGETVTILVVCNDFPAAAAFNYMNGVAITFEDGGHYVDDTFNIGSIGGEWDAVDGIWADMSPAPTTFFGPITMMFTEVDVAADPRLDFLQFNITPVGAGEVLGGGDLFNFGIAFDHPGEYHLGFLEHQDVKRTYYSDNAGTEFFWTETDNLIENITNTITVTE